MINYTFPFPLAQATGVPTPGCHMEAQGQERRLLPRGQETKSERKLERVAEGENMPRVDLLEKQ